MAAEKVDDTTAATIAEAAAGAPVEQPAEPEHKLPPLDIRVFEERDYADVRQLVGDSIPSQQSQLTCRYNAVG